MANLSKYIGDVNCGQTVGKKGVLRKPTDSGGEKRLTDFAMGGKGETRVLAKEFYPDQRKGGLTEITRQKPDR